MAKERPKRKAKPKYEVQSLGWIVMRLRDDQPLGFAKTEAEAKRLLKRILKEEGGA